ncbi:MAG TPA: D-glycerate dehydrogenase [Lentisphaeria bacterium]|nr:MAG: D-glycerate dehydrogenase [Lentisphaerae bacterium GWF2_38_69]HBM15063.1 D-glycerate dehydrogenase [Lentisphaeria bacterium]
MKPKLYITYKIPEKPLGLLEGKFDISINPSDKYHSKAELCEKVRGMDALICTLAETIDKEVIDCMDKAKVIANYAVGYNNIDFAYAAQKGIMVTNTPGVLTNATADLAWALLFAVARRIVDSDRFTREGKFKGWIPTLFLGQEITGKTLGIIGAGKIGANFAKKASGFNMRILYNNRNRNLEFEKEANASFVDKDTLLKESDFISLHAPLTPETRHMIGMPEFKKMKRTAVLINTSRGPVVDEEALVTALKEGLIWGAGLDVYENEPQIEPELFKFENVVMAPHIGSATEETREKMAEMAIKNVLAAINGQKPPNCVNMK